MDEQTMVQDILLMKQNTLTPCAVRIIRIIRCGTRCAPLRPVCGG